MGGNCRLVQPINVWHVELVRATYLSLYTKTSNKLNHYMTGEISLFDSEVYVQANFFAEL